jgi:uncharacterized protein
MLANTFVKDPNEVVKVGDIVKVKVLEIDIPRKRISLTMRLTETPGSAIIRPTNPNQKMKSSSKPAPAETALGNALLAAMKNKVK